MANKDKLSASQMWFVVKVFLKKVHKYLSNVPLKPFKILLHKF
jgi:hypothetical protein